MELQVEAGDTVRLDSLPTKISFEHNGHFYARVEKEDSVHAKVTSTPGYAACMNLRSHTMCGVSLDAKVRPVDVICKITPKKEPPSGQGQTAVPHTRSRHPTSRFS